MGLGAHCVTCNEKRRRFLKAVELHGAWKAMCFNCAGQLLVLSPLPPSLAALREAVSRERRKKDRRFGKTDSRVFKYERRVGERRYGREDYPSIEDEMIIEVSVEDGDAEPNDADLTQIRELLTELRPAELTQA